MSSPVPVPNSTRPAKRGRSLRATAGRCSRGAALAAIVACAAATGARASEAGTGAPRYAFAVLTRAIASAADESTVQRSLEDIARERDMAFVVYDGNLKGAREACSDSIYSARAQLLEASRVPLVFVPGQHDWADCGGAQGSGRYDALERLDFLRQTLFGDSTSMGQRPFALTREGEMARFHPYRENVRWLADETVFVDLNVVGGNNRYSSAGGRNGEFDDRAIATAFWLEHAAEYAKRRAARALVVFIEADPDFARYEHAERFGWLRFGRTRPRDGYLEFKRSLVKAAQTFRGPIILIHDGTRTLAGGFAIDQPLFDDKGERVQNLTRIALAPRDPAAQWLRVDVDFGRQPPFRVSLHTVPRNLPVPPALPFETPGSTPTANPAASTPQIPAIPEIESIPAAPPAPPAPRLQEPASEPPLIDLRGQGSLQPATPLPLNREPRQQP